MRRIGQIVLRLIEILLRSQNGGEIRRPLTILNHRDTQRAVRGLDAIVQVSHRLARVEEHRDPILDLLLRLEHRVLIAD